MTVIEKGFRSDGPEMPGLTLDYFERRLSHSEALLKESLQALNMASEGSREGHLGRLSAQLALCENAAFFASHEPTPIMQEARALLDVGHIEQF